jgi:hypothetical protein
LCCTRTASANPARFFPALGVQGIPGHLHSFLAHLTRCTGRSRNVQHQHIGPRAGADNVLVSLLVAWHSHGDNSAMKSLTSGAERSNLDLPVISALAIDFNATTQQMQLSAARSSFCRRKWPVACSI